MTDKCPKCGAMSFFNEGRSLIKIYLADLDKDIEVGKNGCKSITVRMENGPAALIPWAECVFDNGIRSMINLSIISAIVEDRDTQAGTGGYEIIFPQPADAGEEVE